MSQLVAPATHTDHYLDRIENLITAEMGNASSAYEVLAAFRALRARLAFREENYGKTLEKYERVKEFWRTEQRKVALARESCEAALRWIRNHRGEVPTLMDPEMELVAALAGTKGENEEES